MSARSGFDAGVLQQPTAGGVIVAGALSIGEREALFSWLAEDRLVCLVSSIWLARSTGFAASLIVAI